MIHSVASHLRALSIAVIIMADLPLGRADYHRSVAKEARIQTRNRYYEQNPVLTDSGTALIARPGLNRWLYVGEGPIRSVYSQPGDFNEALFTVSGTEWYRVDTDATKTLIQSGLNNVGSPSQAATGTIGDGASAVPEYLFMADGRNLYLYIENSYAVGTITGTPVNNDTVTIGTTVYKFTNASVDAGSPAGTLANPWLVALGASTTVAWLNFGNAVNVSGVPGTDYSTATTVNDNAQKIATGPGSAQIRANTAGAVGDGIVTTETGAAISWAAAALQDGGTPQVTIVQTPNDVGVIGVAYIASYVVVVPAQGEGINGRFYWIDPGETTIDPLNFATAERAPDPIFAAIVFGDQFWLPGSNTTEVWYFTGNIDAPVSRLQGVTFDRGTWEGTAIQVKESMIIVDSDGGVFQIAGGLNKISNPSIEQRIRQAIQYQASRLAV